MAPTDRTAAAIGAIRESVAYARRDDVAHVRITGAGAPDALDRVCSTDLHLRDGQMLQTLLLNDDATCFADAYLGCDDEEFFLITEGPTAAELTDYLRHHTSPVAGVEIEDRSNDFALLTLDGPFAWELLGRAIGQESIGLPYLSHFQLHGLSCYRAGKTGEYGYGIVANRTAIDEVHARVVAMGTAFDAVEAGLEALDQCALENWFFRIRHEGRAGLTPIELQLQWRVSYRKEYVGATALAHRRSEGARARITCVVSANEVMPDDAIVIGDTPVGRVVHAGWSASLGEWVSLGLIDCAYAHPGIELGLARGSGAARPARSVSPPVLNNRSLFVSPQLHSYSTRHEQTFPPLRRR